MLAILTFSTVPSLSMVEARIDWDLTASSEVLRSSVVSAGYILRRRSTCPL